ITQVNIGNRSRSPLSPLSLRMMSREDLTMLPSCCVVVGVVGPFALGAARAICACLAVSWITPFVARSTKPSIRAGRVALRGGRHCRLPGRLLSRRLRLLIEQRLKIGNGLDQPLPPPERRRDLARVPVVGDRRHLQDVWEFELCHAVLGV